MLRDRYTDLPWHVMMAVPVANLTSCGSMCGVRCECVELAQPCVTGNWWTYGFSTHVHNLLLAPHADGSSDLLYAHADMWLSRRMYTVLRGPRRQQIHMPGSYKRPNYPTNEPVTESSAMTSCHTPGEADFYSERWIGWNNSNRAGCNNGAVWKAFCWANTCSAMLQSGRTDELDLLLQSANTCCYSWSDLLYLPSHER